MVKNVFTNLSKGFFYTIGKIIAIAFVLLVIATLMTKIDYSTFDIRSLLN